MTVRPRQTIHRGSVEAIGVVVASFAGDEQAARRRIVELWRPGTVVFALAEGQWFVRWPSPRRLRCDRAPGLPVTVHGQLLLTAPLADDELAALAAPPSSLVHVHHGACEVAQLDATVDIDAWLDVDGFEIVEVGSLGDPPRPAAPSYEPAPQRVRAIFKHLVAAAPADARDVARAMRALAMQRHGGDGPAVAPAREAPGAADTPVRKAPWFAGAGVLAVVAAIIAAPAVAVTALGVLATLPLMLLAAAAARRVLASASPPPSAPAPHSHALPPPPPLPAPAAAPRPSWLRQALTRLLARTGLMRALGHRHAQYLRRMIDMFERGDFAEALRHAIPLGSDDGDANPGPPVLGGLGPRQDLQIHPTTAAAGSSLLLAGDDFSFLRQVYRKAFDRLVRDGRIDEAAFLLAELLHADEEAVAFLERHDRGRLAAEIAEARNLAPGLVVRQWFLAGERERAVLVARRKGAFADAVARLERDPERRADAAALRLAWAETLAAGGDYEVAVEIATPVPEAMSRVRQWLGHAIDRGGSPGARMLARKLQRFPGSLAEHRDVVARLTDADDPAHVEARVSLLDGLVAGTVVDDVRTASRPLIRALLADAARGERTVDEAKVRKLALVLGDDALRVDLPAWPKLPLPTPLHARTTPLTIDIGPGDVGAIAVHDVAVLPDGTLLVALGELGVRLYDRRGKLVWHADQPAGALVVSDHGDRAIAVIRRGRDVVRLARIDVARRKASSWCEARLDRWAASFDGHTWLVSETSSVRPDRSQLVVVDALVDTELRALDRRDFDGGRVHDVARAGTVAVAIVVQPDGELERWRWDLPEWTLRRRELLPRPEQLASSLPPPLVPAPTSPLGPNFSAKSLPGEHVARYHPAPPNAQALLHVSREGKHDGSLSAALHLPAQVTGDGLWLAVITLEATCPKVHVMSTGDHQPRLVVGLGAGADPVLRLCGETLAIADARGRVLVIDLRDGALSRSLRVL